MSPTKDDENLLVNPDPVIPLPYPTQNFPTRFGSQIVPQTPNPPLINSADGATALVPFSDEDTIYTDQELTEILSTPVNLTKRKERSGSFESPDEPKKAIADVTVGRTSEERILLAKKNELKTNLHSRILRNAEYQVELYKRSQENKSNLDSQQLQLITTQLNQSQQEVQTLETQLLRAETEIANLHRAGNELLYSHEQLAEQTNISLADFERSSAEERADLLNRFRLALHQLHNWHKQELRQKEELFQIKLQEFITNDYSKTQLVSRLKDILLQLQNQRKELKNRERALLNEGQIVTNNLQDTSEKLNEANRNLERKTQQYIDLLTASEEQKTAILQLDDELKSAQSQQQSDRAGLESCQKALHSAKTDLFKERTAIRNLQTTNLELTNKQHQLTTKIAGLEKEVNELKKDKPSIKALEENYAKQLDLSTQEIEALQNQLKDEADKRNAVLKDREDEILSITGELSTARSEIDRLTIHTTTLENNAIKLEEDIDRVNKEYKELLKKMSEEQLQQQQLQQQLQQQQTQQQQQLQQQQMQQQQQQQMQQQQQQQMQQQQQQQQFQQQQMQQHPQPQPRQQQQQVQQPIQQVPVIQQILPPPLAPIFQQGMGQHYLANQLPPQFGPVQQQYQQWAITNTMIERLGDISSGQDRKEIPNYNGYANDKSITDWLREAEAIAVISNWHVDVKKKYIGSRLKGTALSWHVERLRDYPNETFDDWKQALIYNFQHPADTEKLKHKLHNLMQTKDQRTTHFISQIKTLYFSAYGERVPDNNAGPRNVLRDEMLLKILVRGLQPKIKDAMWLRLPPNYEWDDVTRAAINAEKMIIAKELNDTPSVNAINYNSNETNPNSFDQQKRIEELERSIKSFLFNQAGQSHTGQPTDIAAISSRHYQQNSNVQFNPYVQQHRYGEASGHQSGKYNGNQQMKNQDEGSHQSRGRSRSFDKNYKQNQRGSSTDRNQRGPSYDKQYRSPSYERNYKSPSRDRDGQRSSSASRYNVQQSHQGQRSRSGSKGRETNQNKQYSNNASRNNSQDRRGKSPHPKEVVCHRCGNIGHFAKECWTKLKKPQGQKKSY
jgi:hypothetical protein